MHVLEESLGGSSQCNNDIFLKAFKLFWLYGKSSVICKTRLKAARKENTKKKQSKHSMQGPYRHYVLNAIWILINLLCSMLTIFHLRKLYMDYTKTNIEALRVHRLFSVTLNMEKQAR